MSGFFIAADRVITNRHVIERSSRVSIQLMDGKKFIAKGVLAKRCSDLPRECAVGRNLCKRKRRIT